MDWFSLFYCGVVPLFDVFFLFRGVFNFSIFNCSGVLFSDCKDTMEGMPKRCVGGKVFCKWLWNRWEKDWDLCYGAG